MWERGRVAGFDAETHLRQSEPSGLVAAAQALVAVGCIDAAAAQAVLDDRGVGGASAGDPELTTPRPRPRVVACTRELERPAGTLVVHHVILSAGRTELGVTLREAPDSDGGPPSAVLTDDRGTRVGTDFTGAGDDLGW